MRYYTCNDLCRVIFENIWKVPRNIDAVVGIARSGMLPATLIAEHLNKPLFSVDSFNAKVELGRGNRGRYITLTQVQNILLVDDTCFNGTSMVNNINYLRQKGFVGQIITCAVFGEGKGTDNLDICLQDIRGGQDYFYEWNVFNHYPECMKSQIWDMDGVICVEPPDERNREAYEQYIERALPLHISVYQIGAICTSRLEKYRPQTEAWLAKVGVKYGELEMVNLPDYDSRARWNRYAEHKAEYYAARPWAKLFIESSEWQANRIYQITGKPVLSIESNTLKGWQ